MEGTQELQSKARALQERIGPRVDEAKQNLNDLNERVSGFIRERPGTCLLGALAVGFVIGRIASR